MDCASPIQVELCPVRSCSRSVSEPGRRARDDFCQQNAALEGFNRWTINGVAYPTSQMIAQPLSHLREGKRYRLCMKNASDDIHPVHLHRHSFELAKIAGQPTPGVLKDVVMLAGYRKRKLISQQTTRV